MTHTTNDTIFAKPIVSNAITNGKIMNVAKADIPTIESQTKMNLDFSLKIS